MKTDDIAKLIQMIDDSNYCIALTGAGVSTLSGIQDFRGKDGFYQRRDIDPEKIFDLDCFMVDPSYYYLNSKDFIYRMEEKSPSIVHQALANLEQKGKLKAVITQNIDMLHQKAGSANVIEIHGSPYEHTCLQCGMVYPYQEIAAKVQKDIVPICKHCNGTVKPNITFFGEMLPEQALSDAIRHAASADLILVLGSSLVVHPAASIPLYTVQHGGKMVIVNNQPTPLDDYATLVYEDLAEVFEELVS